MRSPAEALLLCSPELDDAAGRAALGSFAAAIRRDAPSVDVRDVVLGARPGRIAGTESLPPRRVAVPLVLTEGTTTERRLGHLTSEVPGLAVARPLGPDWTIAEIVVQRLIEAGARHGDVVVLGVAGSEDARAIEGYSRAARLVSAVWGGPVHIGSVSGRDTSLTDAIDIARAYARRVVVASYALTPGPVATALRRSGADLVTAPLLDGRVPDPRLPALVLQRFHQALGLGVVAF